MAAEYVDQSRRTSAGLTYRPRRPTIRGMLNGISPCISLDLLTVLFRMGHGDELVLADAHFPAESHGQRVVRCDGHRLTDILDGILPLMSLDRYVPTPTTMMSPVLGDQADPNVAASYHAVVLRHHAWAPEPTHIPRADFYVQARAAFAIVVTGETTRYGNLIIRRGNDA